MNHIYQLRTDNIIAIIGATGRGIGLLKKEIELIEKGRAEDGGFFRVHCSGGSIRESEPALWVE